MQENKNIVLWIPYVVYSDTKLSGNAKLILAEILSLLKVDRRWCWASNGHFAEMLGLERRNVSYHINQLEKNGWIKTEATKNCDIEECRLGNSGWHRHIFPGTPLSKILHSLGSQTSEPMKSVGTISITKRSTLNNNIGVATKNKKKKTNTKIVDNLKEDTMINGRGLTRIGKEYVRKISDKHPERNITTPHQAYGFEVIDRLKLPEGTFAGRVIGAVKDKSYYNVKEAIKRTKKNGRVKHPEAKARYFFKVLKSL